MRKIDRWFTAQNLLGWILIICSILWKFGIGEASDLVFLLVFGFGCFLVSEQPFLNFLKEAFGRLRGQNDS